MAGSLLHKGGCFSELEYDILALTETHDTGSLQPSKTFVTGNIAPKDDPYAGVAILMAQRIK